MVPYMLWLFRYMGITTSTPPISGKALANIATTPEYANKTGTYILLDKVAKSSEESYDETKQRELWSWTMDTLATDESQKQRFMSL